MTMSAQAATDEAETELGRRFGEPRPATASPANLPTAAATTPPKTSTEEDITTPPSQPPASSEPSPSQISQTNSTSADRPSESGTSQTSVTVPVTQQTRSPLGSRRLTVHGSVAVRPSLLTRQIQFKSSSAVPTLNTTSAVPLSVGSTTSSRRPTLSSGVRPGSSDGTTGPASSNSRRASMAGHDLSAADLLRQDNDAQVSHRFFLSPSSYFLGYIISR